VGRLINTKLGSIRNEIILSGMPGELEKNYEAYIRETSFPADLNRETAG
jgi:hypothetical protein